MEATVLITGNRRNATYSVLLINAFHLQLEKKNSWKQDGMLRKISFL